MSYRITPRGATTLIAATIVLGGAFVPAAAQSAGDAAAYIALAVTPVGGLPDAPLLGATMLKQSGFAGRYGRISTGGSFTDHQIAATWFTPAGSGQLNVTGGAIVCDGCTGNIGLGVNWLKPLTDGQAQVGIRPSIGISKPTNESGMLYAAALSLPLSWVAEGGSTTIVPFVEPGFGFGGLRSSGFSESGTRLMLSGGAALSVPESGFALVVSARKIFIEGGEVVYGLGFQLGR